MDHLVGSDKTLVGWMFDNVAENGKETILKDIAHVNFTALTFLHLGSNKIVSIEEISQM